MIKEDVIELIKELNDKQTETISIEVKSAKMGVPEKFYDTISSFSNTLGGVILFGVEEIKKKGKTIFEIVGVNDINELQKNITNLCCKEFEPVIRPEIDVIEIDKKNIVAVRIEMLNARYKPCYYKPKGMHKGSYIRVGDRDDNMSEYEIYKCISYKENVRDDLKPVTRATIKDLDENLINKFIVNAKIDKPKFAEFSDEEILLQYGVLTHVEDKIFPTVAGIMVFEEYPELYPEELKGYQKTSDKASDKTSDKTSDKIIEYLKQNDYITTKIASELLKLSQQRTRAILARMTKEKIIIADGANRNRKYIINK